MHGITVFTSLSAAIHQGFQIYERTDCGYLVRCKTDDGWALALVELKRRS